MLAARNLTNKFNLALIVNILVITLIVVVYQPQKEWIDISYDRTLAEYYEALLLISSAFMLYAFANKYKCKVFRVLSVFFIYAAFDNLFLLHERAGDLLKGVDIFSSVADIIGTTGNAVGELFFLVIVSAGFTLWFLRNTDLKQIYKESIGKVVIRKVLTGLAVLFFVGVGYDFLEAATSLVRTSVSYFIEDFIELLTIVYLFLSIYFYYLLPKKSPQKGLRVKRKTPKVKH